MREKMEKYINNSANNKKVLFLDMFPQPISYEECNYNCNTI